MSVRMCANDQSIHPFIHLFIHPSIHPSHLSRDGDEESNIPMARRVSAGRHVLRRD